MNKLMKVVGLVLVLSANVSFAKKMNDELKGQIYNYFDKHSIHCEYLEHVEDKQFGNVIVYDLTCRNNDNIKIYQYVPEQFVMTHYIED